MVAVVEDVDRLAGEDVARELEQRHVRPAPGAVHGEEPQPRHRQAIERGVGVRHQLVRLLGRGVERERMIHVLVHAERHLRVRAVHRARRCEHQVLDAVVTAALQHVQRARQVAVGVGVRVLDRVAHAGLRREVHDAADRGACEQRFHRRAVGEVDAREAESLARREAREARLLERRVVVRVQVVEADDLVAAREQPLADVVADEARRAGHENAHQSRPSA